MNSNVDSMIFIGFLIITIVIGLRSSRGIKTIKEFAIGNRDFSTATISATIIATWISGSMFFNKLSGTYEQGLYIMWVSAGNVLPLILIGWLLAPRMREFLGKLSIAEAMGELYGEKARIITAAAGFVGAAGFIAVQLKVGGILFHYCFNCPEIYGIIISAVIIILYSSLGGIKSVTFTDVIQLITFGTIIPTIVYFILREMDNLDLVFFTLKNNELFDYKKVFDFTESKSLYYLFFFLYVIIPGFNPAIFQRITMARNVIQVQKSFLIAGFACLFIGLIISWISILLLSTNPGLDPKKLVPFIFSHYSYIGLTGLILAGIMAMVMSTADSYLNSTAVLFVHDFCKPLKIFSDKQELFVTRIASLIIGIFAVIIAIKGESLLKIIITTNSFYIPIVDVPFLVAILGFRSSGKSVLIGMAAGFLTVALWKIADLTFIEAIIPGMVMNLTFLIGSHYLLKQPGGFVKVHRDNNWQTAAPARKLLFSNYLSDLTNFKIKKLLKTNTPSAENLYIYVGIFCIIDIYTNMHTLPRFVQLAYPELIEFITVSSLFAATALLSYPLWLKNWKGKTLVAGVVWNSVLFYVLICSSFAVVIMSNFAQVQLMVFMVNLIILASLLRWQWLIMLLVVGIFLTQALIQLYIEPGFLEASNGATRFKVAYMLLVISGALIIFLKPKQEYQELTEEKNEYLNSRIGSQEIQLREAQAIKGEFIRNINHEYHAPMTGIISMAQVLSEAYDKLNDKQRKEAADAIYKSSIKLESFDANISSLAKLSNPAYELKLQEINLSKLLRDRVETCRKLYEGKNEDREFILLIQEGITINADKYYLTQTLDNLIINSIIYCKKGKITVTLKSNAKYLTFTIEDDGIGIPPDELNDIFCEFIVSSKTRTPAGGRGVGLALCKRVIEVHGGQILAKSDGVKGAIFKFTMPIITH